MEQVITWATLILFSLYTYLKILNIHLIGVPKILYGIVFSGLLSYGVFLLKAPLPYGRFVVMLLALGVFASLATRTRLDLAFTGIVISVGINYGFTLAFAVISAALMYLLSQPESILISLLAAALQSLFLVLIFKIRRFKRGVLFLQKRRAGAIGLVISGVMLLAVTLINNRGMSDEPAWWYFIGIILCAGGLIFWWRSGITRLYRERIKERDRQEYERLLKEKDEETHKLQKSNDSLAKIVHTDNKLLMAMHELVKLYHDHSKESDYAGLRPESKRILNHMEELIRERSGALTHSQRVYKFLPPTGNTVIDGLMRYMLSKASDHDIQFDVTVIGEISELTETVLPGLPFEILCADLIENAIIAATYSDYRRVLVTLGTSEGIYELNVQDSGRPFEIETLLALGVRKASTRLEEGGSGIGYMTIFEILHKHKASIIITEFPPKQYGFTKSVRVRFDGQDHYFVYTPRADEFSALQDETSGSPVVLPRQQNVGI